MFITVIVILLSIDLLVFGAALYLCCYAVFPRTHKSDYIYRHEVEAEKLVEAEWNRWQKEEFLIPSPHGYNLQAVYLPLEGSQKTVVISHGITWGLYGMVKYMGMFRKRGFNVLLYDLRHHGRSGGPNTTFGFYEKHDLKAVVDWAFEHLGAGGKVGTMGESLGAATTLQHAALEPRLAFVVSDCAYSDLCQLFEFRFRSDYGFPPILILPIASLISRALTGMAFEQVSPISCIDSIQAPTFFIHGQNDTYIPPHMSEEMHAARRGLSELYLAPNAGHAQAYWNNRDEYDREIGRFLEKIGLGET